MLSKSIGYVVFNWKKLALANVVGMALQGTMVAGLVAVGVETLPAMMIAKATSWMLFLIQMSK